MFPDAPMAAMPVFSSGQTVRQAAPTYEAIGTTDIIFAPGGGLSGHPGGVRAGVAAPRKAWDAAAAGVPLDDVARHDADVAAAMRIGR
jgi:ribulose-bisphosphate carboxylase large chain